MFSKVSLLVLGLSAMVVLGEVRDLVESTSKTTVVKQQNDGSGLQYGTKACVQGDESSDCFWPWIPGVPSLPCILGLPCLGTPPTPTTSPPPPPPPTSPPPPPPTASPPPPTPTPSPPPPIPPFKVVKEQNDASDHKYGTKACVQGDESSDCFLIPGVPSLPCIPGLPCLGTPPAKVVKQQNDTSDHKYGTKACVQGDESSDCFLIPGVPSLPCIPGLPCLGTPPAKIIKDASDIKNEKTRCIEGSENESSDCFLVPGEFPPSSPPGTA